MDNLRRVKLITENYTRGNFGQEIASESFIEVFGNISSITRNEWTSAGQRGVDSSLSVNVYSFEYNGEDIVEIDGVRYSVYRKYINTGNDITELYLETREGITYAGEEIDEIDIPAYNRAYEILSSSTIPTFYGHAPKGQTLPYITYELDSDNFEADNKVYFENYILNAKLYTARKSLKCERLLINAFEDNEFVWERGETDDLSEHEYIQEFTGTLVGGE